MPDLLRISNLSLMTRIGIHAWEQRILQQLRLDIEIPIDISKCHDELSKTVDYAAVCEHLTHLIENNAFSLIETVAEKVAEHIKNNFHVQQLTVTVSKPHAIKQAGNISVSITR